MRAVLLAVLRRGIRDGRVVIVDGDRRFELGVPSGLHVEIRVVDRRAYGACVRHGSIGLADSYAAGWWECDDLVGLISLAARNVRSLDRLRRRLAPVLIPGQRAGAIVRRSTPARARRDIAPP